MKMKITAVCLAIALLAAICASALGEGVTLSVRGTGAVYVESDCATISIGVRMNGGQVAEAQAAVNERIDAVIAQDPGHAVRSALRIMRARSDHRELLASQEHIRIEVLLKENLQFA